MRKPYTVILFRGRRPTQGHLMRRHRLHARVALIRRALKDTLPVSFVWPRCIMGVFGRRSLTCRQPVGHRVLRPTKEVHEGPQSPVEGLDPVHREVQHRVSGGVVEVYPQDAALGVHSAQRGRGRRRRRSISHQFNYEHYFVPFLSPRKDLKASFIYWTR